MNTRTFILRNTPGGLFLALAAAGCVSLDYDLSTVPVPISAKPAAPDAGEVVPFTIEAMNVLWAHGAFGHHPPDVAALLAEEARGYDRIAGLRVEQRSGFHQWLVAHLSLTLVRMRTVVIEGQLVKDR
jgi:hypothetical protein